MSSPLEELGHSVKKLQSRHHKALDARLQSLGISLVQWNALRAIHDHPQASANALAEISFNSAQAFGTLSNRLVQLGFVERNPGKGRANTHTLTPQGERLLKEGRAVVLDSLKVSFSPLTPQEQTTLLKLLAKCIV
jgi:DNA-binding MarR family transcriptional regulator